MNQSINTDSKNSKEPQQKYRLGTVSIKILGGLNRFYRRLTSPSASIMAQNIQLFGPRGGFLTHQWIITWNKLSLNLQLLDQLEFLLNVFILILFQTVFTVSPVRFIPVYVKANKMSSGPWVQTEKWKKDIIAESFRAVGGASDLLHDFVQGVGHSSNSIYCIYFIKMDHVFIWRSFS